MYDHFCIINFIKFFFYFYAYFNRFSILTKYISKCIAEKIHHRDKRLRHLYSFFNFVSRFLFQLILSSMSVLLLPPIIICTWFLEIFYKQCYYKIYIYIYIFGKVPRSKDNRKHYQLSKGNQIQNYLFIVFVFIIDSWDIAFMFLRSFNVKYYGWHFILNAMVNHFMVSYYIRLLYKVFYTNSYPLHLWIFLLIPYQKQREKLLFVVRVCHFQP